MENWVAVNQATLEKFKTQFDNKDLVINFEGHFYPTKGDSGVSNGTIHRQLEVENAVRAKLEKDDSYNTIVAGYQRYDSRLTDTAFPRHYASKFVDLSGPLTDNHNIFLFFPEALGIRSDKMEDYFGVEFIDVWRDVFEEIVLPCATKVFCEQSNARIASVLNNLEQTIYMASVFHEIGHRVSPWKVSPCKDPRVNIKPFYLDVLGELSTDSLMVWQCQQFEDLALFVMLQRIFWFGRFGHDRDPKSGSLNSDNDCWNGAYLWHKYLENDVLVPVGDKWQIHFERIVPTFKQAVEDIDGLAQTLFGRDDQDELVFNWMKQRVEYVEGKGFVYPQSMKAVLDTTTAVRYKPTVKFANSASVEPELEAEY